MPLEHYWFDPDKCKLYGPDQNHEVVLSKIEELSDLANSFDQTRTMTEKMLERNWCRIYYQTCTMHIGLHTNENKDAAKAIRFLIRDRKMPIESACLDIHNSSIFKEIDQKILKAFLKTGQIKL